jgi:hypothetical protein
LRQALVQDRSSRIKGGCHSRAYSGQPSQREIDGLWGDRRLVTTGHIEVSPTLPKKFEPMQEGLSALGAQ